MIRNSRPLKTSLLLIVLAIILPAHAEVPEQRQQELRHLLKHDCGSCHGMTRNGGLGPALLPETLKDKPDELLFVTIREGRHGTPMPPWKSLLSDDDIHWLIKLLRASPE